MPSPITTTLSIDGSQIKRNHRNLVVVRAGDDSLHERWLAGPEDRTWDIVISYFGDDPERYRRPDVVRIDAKGPKWPALHDLVQARKADILCYDFVWFPDDDLDADTKTINSMFSICAALGLQLAQPALILGSHLSHAITLKNRAFVARTTNFVEIMAPVFSSAFLARCAPTFNENRTGWGLDLLWPSLCPDATKVAIIDACTVRHTRPVGGPNYAAVRASGGQTPAEEMQAVVSKYGLAGFEPQITSGIDLNGRGLSVESGTGREFIEAIIAGYLPEFANAGEHLISLVRPALLKLTGMNASKPSQQSPTVEQLVKRLTDQGKPAEAIDLLETAMIAGETSELRNDWAALQLACGNQLQAEQGFRRAIELDPTQRQPAVNLAMLLMMQERFQEIVPILEPITDTLSEAERQAMQQLLSRAGINQASVASA